MLKNVSTKVEICFYVKFNYIFVKLVEFVSFFFCFSVSVSDILLLISLF